MNISQAIELAEKSMGAFEARLKELSMKELYDLTDNLRFANYPEIFKISHDILINKLLHFLKTMENFERKANARGIDEIRGYIRDKTGFHMDSETPPSIGLKKYIEEIISWSK